MAKTSTSKVSATFLDELIRDYLSLSEQVQRLETRREHIEQQLRVALEVSPDKAATTPSGSAVLVESDLVRYDLATLQKALPPETLARVSHVQIDKDLVEAAVSVGLIPAQVADRARRLIKRKPQLRVRQPSG
ncbi:MAG TPA: hypothetical protein V6D00_11790 [Pantanalinema sp.]